MGKIHSFFLNYSRESSECYWNAFIDDLESFSFIIEPTLSIEKLLESLKDFTIVKTNRVLSCTNQFESLLKGLEYFKGNPYYITEALDCMVYIVHFFVDVTNEDLLLLLTSSEENLRDLAKHIKAFENEEVKISKD